LDGGGRPVEAARTRRDRRRADASDPHDRRWRRGPRAGQVAPGPRRGADAGLPDRPADDRTGLRRLAPFGPRRRPRRMVDLGPLYEAPSPPWGYAPGPKTEFSKRTLRAKD